MKRRLTVTVDADLIPGAKRYAHSQGMSLSALVEQRLRDKIREWKATEHEGSDGQSNPPAEESNR